MKGDLFSEPRPALPPGFSPFGGMEDRSFSQCGLSSTTLALEYLYGVPEIDIGRVVAAFMAVESFRPTVLFHNSLALLFSTVAVDELAQA